MGGDHKCPVCQATFTRPQHVARHMRSHTGDRPYKCVYCGDQFARSDLLSRHVNKCHANEKPITQSGTRRKGSAAATRATTSKQACDQCVQSSLPCDGCNPCAKCVQRKCRCTFVKFHRQTAPVGPGHIAPQNVTAGVGQPLPPAANLMGSRLGPYPRSMHSVDPLGLGPVPLSATSSTSTAMNDPIYADHFTFGLYPSSAPTGSLNPETPADYANRYRANAAELMRRDAIPGISQPQQTGLTSSSWPGWNQPHDQDPRYPPHGQDGTDIVSGLPNASASYQHGFYTNGRRESIDLDFSGSDSASHSDHSVPSSATSSSIHLPLGPMDGLAMPMSQSYQGSLGDGASFPGEQPHHGRNSAQQHERSSSQSSTFEGRDAGFSSAFGLMSLDDPNVIAGLATDGAPFFSHAGMDTNMDPDATPMQLPPPHSSNRPPLQNRPSTSTGYHWSGGFSLNTPGRDREADTKELKDFWKQYMRTPLSGPGPANPPPSGSPVKAETPGGMYRRPRVNSLPSVKTPLGPPGSSQYGYHQSHPFAIPTIQPKKPSGDSAGGGISSRTVHGTAEDLRSYEAAVLARKAPTTLSLNPRRRGTLSGAPSGSSTQDHSPPLHPASTIPQPQDSSSLVNAFGGGQLPLPRPTFAETNVPRVTFVQEHEYSTRQMDSPVHDSSRESSVDISDSSSGDGHDSHRPSFKRLPSQTLEPANSKRTQLMRENGNNGLGNGVGVPSHTSSQMSLAERRRRMSAPSGPGPLELGPLPQ